MREALMLRFLYRTVPGRMVLKLLVHPRVSETAGYYLSLLWWADMRAEHTAITWNTA